MLSSRFAASRWNKQWQTIAARQNEEAVFATKSYPHGLRLSTRVQNSARALWGHHMNRPSATIIQRTRHDKPHKPTNESLRLKQQRGAQDVDSASCGPMALFHPHRANRLYHADHRAPKGSMMSSWTQYHDTANNGSNLKCPPLLARTFFR